MLLEEKGMPPYLPRYRLHIAFITIRLCKSLVLDYGATAVRL